MSTRVAFRFPNGEEIRYPDRIPERGDRIQSTGGEAFLVSHVERDDGGYVPTCIRHSEYASETQQAAHNMRDLAAQMRQRAVELAKKTKAGRQRRRARR